MKQTVVGVFETSEEAHRAQAALLDAQFSPASVRISAGGTLRGVDEGMAYPVGGPRSFDAAQLDASDRTPLAHAPDRASPHPARKDNPLERVTEFFKGLFSPESQREELSRYEEALRRGGALVAIEVDDEVEQTLASDILIRTGAYDLEERAAQWELGASTSLPPAREPESVSVRPQPARSAALPGNVTSMDPSDATGYRASRTDFLTGETWPASRTAFDSAQAAGDARGPVRHEDLAKMPVGAPSASWDRLQGDFGVAGDYGAARAGDAQLHDDAMHAEPLQPGAAHTEGMRAMQTEHGMVSGNFGEERVQPTESVSHHPSTHPRTPAWEAWDRAANTGAPEPHPDVAMRSHMSPEAPPDLDTPVIRSRDLDRPATTAPAQGLTHMASPDRASQGDSKLVSSTEASHLLASGAEVFLDDSGFARLRNGGRVQPMTSPESMSMTEHEPAHVARNVRVYSRRADDPTAWHEAHMRDDSFEHGQMDERQAQQRSVADCDPATLAARDRRMTDASLRTRDCDDARDPTSLGPWTLRGDEPAGSEGVQANRLSRDPASPDWAADWDERRAERYAMASPGPDDFEADRLGDEAAARSAAAMQDPSRRDTARREELARREAWRDVSGREADASSEMRADAWHEPAPSQWDAAAPETLPRGGMRPTGADDLARREAALREEALSDPLPMQSSSAHPEWRDSSASDPRERAAELARREATLRDQTLQDYAAMDERAEMRAANAAAAAHAKDMGAELGMHSPVDDRMGAHRTALDDGAPLARGGYEDDARQYAAQDDAVLSGDDAFVDTRDPHRRDQNVPTEWNHMKQAVRNVWHKMTHPGRHH